MPPRRDLGAVHTQGLRQMHPEALGICRRLVQGLFRQLSNGRIEADACLLHQHPAAGCKGCP